MSRTKQHSREEALDRALALFWRQGYYDTSLKDLEKALQMHPGSIYGAFKSKENLYRLVMVHYGTRIRDAREEIMRRTENPLHGLARFLREAHPIVCEASPIRSCMFTRTALEQAGKDGGIKRDLEAHLQASEAEFAKIFGEAQAGGFLPAEADPVDLARRLQIRLMGLGVHAQRPGHEDEARALILELADEVEALGAPGQASRRVFH